MKALMAGIVAGLAVVAAGTGAAQAQTFTFTPGVNGVQGVEVVATDSNTNSNPFYVYAGLYQAQVGAATDVPIFCVDYSNEISNGDSYLADTEEAITDPAGTLSSGYYNGGLASALTPSDYNPTNLATVLAQTRADEVAYLADTYLNATTTTFTNGATFNNNMAAISLSIWDIIQDGGDNLSTGNIQLWNPGGSDNYNYDTSEYNTLLSLTSTYETQAAANSTYTSTTADWIQAPRGSSPNNHLQDYVMEVPGGLPSPHGLPPAPEPAGFVPMLLGAVGLGGLIAKRRRSLA